MGNDLRWIPLLGNFTIEDRHIVFHGAETSPGDVRGGGVEVGNLVCNRHFGGGHVEATITFSDNSELSACGLMLFYEPATRSFVEAQLGGPFLASVMSFVNGQWSPHGFAGAGTIETDRPYRLRATVAGSRVSMSIDGVDVLVSNLPFSLPRGQAGIWCKSAYEIEISDFTIRAERPKAFVVMQFTAPYNELYAEVIKPVCESYGFSALRADETYGPGIIIADIERQIIEAQVVIADITPQNPNVYYEVGFAHALRKQTILIADSATQLPFDVSPFRTLFYENSIAGKSRVEAGLRNHLEAIATAAGIAGPETEPGLSRPSGSGGADMP